MGPDRFDYDELAQNVNDLLDDEYGAQDEFDLPMFEPDLPDETFPFCNAANGYGAQTASPYAADDYDDEAAAMRYDPQTNSGSVIRAYNTDYATRAANRANRSRTAAPRRAAPPPCRPQPPVMERPAPEDYAPPVRPRKRKKRWIWKLLLALLLVLVLIIAALWVFARQPEGARSGHKDGCAAILLAGTDADGTRTDTMMLLYLDENAKEMNLLSLPRDTYTRMDISVPKLNAVYGVAGGGKDGMERLLDYTAECVGYRPDGYVLVDLDCFAHLVDLMGGVQFDVPCDMEYEDPAQDLHIDLRAGEQRLGGKEALWVVRYRSGYAMADLQRVQVQRDFIRAALDQWLTLGNVWKAPAAATLLTANTTTNLSARELAWLARTARAIGTGEMQTETLPGEAAYVGDGSYYIVWPQTTAGLINEHYNPYYEDVSPDSIYSPYY